MLKPDEEEFQKLKNLAHDHGAIIALKKFFLCEIMDKTLSDQTYMLAGSFIALDYVRTAFDKLERMREKEEESTVKKNIV